MGPHASQVRLVVAPSAPEKVCGGHSVQAGALDTAALKVPAGHRSHPPPMAELKSRPSTHRHSEAKAAPAESVVESAGHAAHAVPSAALRYLENTRS